MGTTAATHAKITCSEVNAAPMNGTTVGRLFTDYDTGNKIITLSDSEVIKSSMDHASIISVGVGNAGDTAVFDLFGAPADFNRDQLSPAELIGQVTATLGTALDPDGNRYVDSMVIAVPHHPLTIGVIDVGQNRICRLVLDIIGYKKLVFQPITFTNLTSISFILREFGSKD